MNKEDKDETRQMIHDIIGKPLQEILGITSVTNATLTRLEKYTTTTTEAAAKKIEKLEDEISNIKLADVRHVLNCPQTKRITDLENDSLTRKAIIKFMIAGAAFAATIVGILKYLT